MGIDMRYTRLRQAADRRKVRKLKKQDVRAKAILVTLYSSNINPSGFVLDTEEGRHYYSWRDSWEYDEWDSEPATEHLRNIELLDYQCDCIDTETLEWLPDDMCPPFVSAMKKLPTGWRWRGKRVVRVDLRGAMIKGD